MVIIKLIGGDLLFMAGSMDTHEQLYYYSVIPIDTMLSYFTSAVQKHGLPTIRSDLGGENVDT